ncbi:MAG: MG2 domain-containing protein, partial [Ferruginibacter sp.]
QTLRLDDDKSLDLHQKQHFTLDIDKYLQTEPGAIYHVTIGFRPGYNLYLQDKKGSGVNNARADEEENADEEDDEESTAAQKIYEEDNSLDNFWERYDNYYPYGYSWKKRNDPSHPSYYNKERWATRNIIASNLGLTAKVGNDKTLHVMVTDILTTKAMRGVDFQVMNFQEQVIGKGSSDGDGAAEISLSGEPFLLLAKDGKETGYLKLDDGSALPLDRFDVSGEKIKNGIKGFLFGERGVWRPGDSLFLTCMVESDKGKLPDDFPLEFTLVTPQGQLYQQESMQGIDGFYTWKTATTPEAPTGNWLLKAKIGGASFEKRLKIETVMPNRLKIKLNFPDNELLSPGGTAGSLEALWLFGTPGKNLHAKIDASLYARKTSFPAFAGYSFDNPSRDYQTQSATMFDGNLDEAGKAVIKANFEAGKEAPGMLTANLVTKVFEPGGSFSIDYFSIPYSPYESYAGLKLPEGEKPFNYLLAGRPHSVSLVNTDSHGKLLSGTREVEILYYRVEWRWWWEEGGNNLGNFTQDEYNKLLKKETISLVNGRGSWTFNSGPDDWGRYYIQIKDLKSGHSAGEVFYIDGPGWQSRSGNEDQTAASMLTFSSDKVKYSVGDKVTLSIPSSSGGRVLVSLEDGSRVLNTFWQETTQGQTKVSFTAGKDMAPNIYATVSLLQPHAQTINDLPIRMFGAIPIPVEDKETILNPVLKVPATIRPEEQLSLTVSEQHGKEMTYCIAVVDEGLLDLTRFKTPEPHSAFYAREALGVKSFDVYDYVIGAWGNELERILTIGGDADAGPPKPKQANRFKPVVKFLGPFHIGKNEQYTATFKMPAYVGAVRAMVIAGHSGSYGSAEKSVTVKKPLMVLATLPRVLAPGEQIRVPLTVFAMDNAIKDVEVKITTNPLLGITAGNTQTLHFANTGDKLAYADVTVNNFTGIGKLKVTVSSGRETATDEVELQVRNPNPVISQVSQSTLTGGNKWQNTFTPIGNDENSRVTLEVSSIPQMNLQKRITYLVYYPHGCIEQTTSAVFPQLFLNQLSDLDEKQKAEVERNIKAGIEKIAHFQLPPGGFSYWPGMREPDDWGSSYAGHFLTEARNYGYTVSDYIFGQWKTFQRQAANAWAPSSTNFYGGDLAQAYRLYTLALAKAPELGAMNRLKEFKYISAEARWRLAAAYQLAGLSNAAQDLVSGLPLQFPERNFWGFTYGSDTRDEAMVLETLTLMGNRNKGQEVLVGLAAKMNSENWYSTQTTAYTLLAIAKYCGKNPAGQKINAQLMINGSPVTINSSSYIQQVPIFFKAGTNTLELVNKNPNQLFVKLVVQGRPLTGEAVPVINNSGLLAMKISYLTRDGKALNENNLNQGSDFMAKVSVKNTGNMNYTQMALSQVFPSGWEILNARMMDGEGSFTSSPFTYRDVRDDRVYTYFDIEEKKEKIYYVQLNATYPGKYFMPANACSAMYDNRISASTGGKWVVVTNNR